MNCNTVREMLSVIRPDSGDAEQPELASEMVHLEQCADCRTYLENQQRSDRDLGAALRKVAVPVGLKARILAELAVATATPAVIAAPIEPSPVQPSPVQTVTAPQIRKRSWTRRQLLTVASIFLVAVCGGWWFLHVNRTPTQHVDQLLVLSQDAVLSQAPEFQKSFRPELPVKEIRMSSQVGTARSVQYQKREIGAAIPYFLRLAARRSPVSVMLIVIDLKKVQVPNLEAIPTSFQAADVHYPPPNSYATRVWRVGQNLYVCYVLSHDPQALGALKNQSTTT